MRADIAEVQEHSAVLRTGVGLCVTALYCVLNVFPIIDVPHPLAFTVKIVSVIVLANAVSVALFFASGRRHA